MEDSKHRCYGCGGTFAREELQYRPSGKGAYRKEIYFCPACNEKEAEACSHCGHVFIPQVVTRKARKHSSRRW
jgi:hypothetical protein